MVKIPAFADVSLRILMVLGAYPDKLLTSEQLAEQIAVPYNHVIKAMQYLRKMGLVKVNRGRLGGAKISDAGLEITVGKMLRELDNQPDIAECIRDHNQTCPLIAECRLRQSFGRAREAFYRELDGVTIHSLTTNLPQTSALLRIVF